MATKSCCGRPSANECRCHTEADAIADALRGFVRRRVRRPEDAEDVAQESLLRLYRSAEALDDERALDAWMYQIARSAIIDHHRRTVVRPQPVDPHLVAEVAPAQDEEDDDDEAHDLLAACLAPMLARVPDEYREALELTDLGGLTQEQAAARQGLSVSGMKSRVQRGRRLLRAEVGRCCRVALDARGGLTEANPRGTSDC